MDKCDKCFSAIDFHHTNPKTKESGASLLFRCKPTKERTDIFKEDVRTRKQISLCDNCHREEHLRIGNRGRPKK